MLHIVTYYNFYYQNQRVLMKHKFSLEDDTRPYMNYYKQSQVTENKRLSPEYSSVLQNQNVNLLDTNELSWLQKFAEDNQKICSSGLFDQNFNNSKPSNVTNQMKFSFNMNYSLEDRKKQNQNYPYNSRNNEGVYLGQNQSKGRIRIDESKNVLADIKNTQNVPRGPSRKDSLPGSIKKNQKPSKQFFEEVSQYQRQIAQTPMSKLQQMNERLNKALHKDRSSSLLNGNNKQNVRKDSLKKDPFKADQIYLTSNTDQFQDSLKYYQRNKQISLETKRQIKLKPNQSIKRQQNKIVPVQKYSLALQSLFDKLDKNQLGKLSKTNCSTEYIPEEFKFIFGTILTRIKFKQFICSKSQFTKLSENIIKELDSVQIVDLLTNLFPVKNQISNIGRNQRESYTKVSHNQWQSVDETKRINEKNPFETFEAKQFKKSLSLLESAFKGQSKIQSRINSSLFNEDKSSKITTQSIKKYNEYERPPLKKSVIFDDNPLYVSKNDFQFAGKLQLNDTYSKKYSNISEKTIEQHKKGLDNLNRLNKRMESCLNTNILSQHNKQGLMREDNLKFNELIKHV